MRLLIEITNKNRWRTIMKCYKNKICQQDNIRWHSSLKYLVCGSISLIWGCCHLKIFKFLLIGLETKYVFRWNGLFIKYSQTFKITFYRCNLFLNLRTPANFIIDFVASQKLIIWRFLSEKFVVIWHQIYHM